MYISILNENDTWKISIIHKITERSFKLALNKKVSFYYNKGLQQQKC